MKSLSSILLIILLSAAAWAQSGGSVSGKVSDANGKAIAGSQVTLTAKSNASVTVTVRADADGNFRFENIAAGGYLLTATDGTSSSTMRANESVTVSAGLGATLDLTVLPVVTAEVTIASGTAQTPEQTSKSVSTISGQDIENRNEQTVVDALRMLPGISIQQSGGFGRLAVIKTRGLRNQDTAILIDGQRFRDAGSITGDASPFISDLTETSVRKVEVLRGSGSSLYGTNAIGGVINIQTDDFVNGLHGNFLAEGGSLGLVRGRAGLSGGYHNKAFFNVALSHTNYSDGIDGNDAGRNTSGKVGFRYKFNDKLQLTSRFYASNAFVQLNISPDMIGIPSADASVITPAIPISRAELKRYVNGTPIFALNAPNATFIPDADDPDLAQRSRFYNFHIALDGTANEYVSYRFSYQDLTTKRANTDGPGGPGFFQPFGGNTRSDNNGNIQTFQAKTNISFHSNLVTIGYGFEREKYSNKNFQTTPADNNTTDASQSSNTFVVQDQLAAFNNNLQLSGAFRVQLFDVAQPQFSPAGSPYAGIALSKPPTSYTFDGSAAYFFRSTGTKLRAHGGNGYRAPSLYERFGSDYFTFLPPNPFFNPYGDPGLKPERSFGIDGGVDQSFVKERVRLSGTYFYTVLIDTIGFLTPAPPIGGTPRDFGGYTNQKGGIARGGEFSGEFIPHRTNSLYTSYTYTKSLLKTPDLPGSGILEARGIPVHKFTVVFNQQIGKRFNVNFDFVATSSYLGTIFNSTFFASRYFRFDGASKGDVTAAYEIPLSNEKVKLRLFGTIENIFNQDYYDNGFRTARATARGGLKVSF
jgi:vitamin B12 transporter